MQDRTLKNKDLDVIGRKLVERTRVSDVDIDQIVSSRHLYDLVRARIAASNIEPKTDNERRISFGWRYAAVFAAVLMIVTAGAAMLFISNSRSNSWSAVVVEQVPEAIPVSQARPDHPPKPMFSKLPSGRAFQISAKAKPAKTVNKKTERPTRVEQVHVPQGEFYAISFAGDLEDGAAGGRIIRVDMPRSSLFAMGVNIPLENGREMIKTDLLIGSDGVTRAVRIFE